MGNLAVDRVYDEHTDADVAYLATGAGVARVAVANGRVGRFGLVHRCVARDVAATADAVAVAAEEDVLVHHPELGAEEWVATGFGPAEAIGFDRTDADNPALVAVAADEHEVGRLLDPTADPTDWLTVADVDAPVHAVEGPFLAAGDGVYRLTPDGIEHVGLDDARDVAVPRTERLPAPSGEWADVDALAATGDGVHRLTPGVDAAWERALDGAFDAVGAGGDRALAVGDAGTFLRDPDLADAVGWQAVETPRRPAVVGVGATAYAVTEAGAFLAREDDGWRTRTLGFPEVAAMSVVAGAEPAQ